MIRFRAHDEEAEDKLGPIRTFSSRAALNRHVAYEVFDFYDDFMEEDVCIQPEDGPGIDGWDKTYVVSANGLLAGYSDGSHR